MGCPSPREIELPRAAEDRQLPSMATGWPPGGTCCYSSAMVTERAEAGGREVYRFSVEQYRKLGELGVIGEPTRTELIHGEILRMPPIGTEHAEATSNLTEILVLAFAGRARVTVGNPVTLPPDSEPLPDLMLLKLRTEGYRLEHPGPDSVLLLIEVSDSSLAYDRSTKLALYAAAHIPEYWIVDLPHQQIELHRNPQDGVYRDRHIARREDMVSPVSFPDILLAVDRILR